MTISELIHTLEQAKRSCGDVAVYVDDADTGWAMPITEIETAVYPKGTPCLRIGSDYENCDGSYFYSLDGDPEIKI